jgi:hypothetical protein
LQSDLEQLGEKIEQIGDVSLIMIDPLNAFFGDQVDTHKMAAVRSVLARLQRFADRYDIAILGIMHPPKTIAGGKAINVVTGSLAFAAHARMGFLVTADLADYARRYMLAFKNNLGALPDGLAFKITTTIVTLNVVAPKITWDSTPVHKTANEALAETAEAARERSTELRRAKEFLHELLADGPVLADEAKEKTEAEGSSKRTLRRARKKLRVRDLAGRGAQALGKAHDALNPGTESLGRRRAKRLRGAAPKLKLPCHRQARSAPPEALASGLRSALRTDRARGQGPTARGCERRAA